MARFFTVNGVARLLSVPGFFLSLPLGAQVPTPPKTPPGTPPPAVANPAPGAPKPPVVPLVPADFDRYGKIMVPSEDSAHPLKLNLPFPGIGEMKIPSQDDLNMRQKLEQLATLSDVEIRQKLDQWPPYGKMKIGDQGQMLVHIQQFKDQRSKIAMDKAHALGLTLTPPQQARFEKEYWDKRMKMERDLSRQFEPIAKASNQKMQEELYREFSSSGPVVPPPPGAKPLGVPMPLAQAKPPAPAVANNTAPTAPPKSTGPVPPAGASQPVGQGTMMQH